MKGDPLRVNAIEILERFRVSFRANGKRQMLVEKLVTFQIWNEQKKIVHN